MEMPSDVNAGNIRQLCLRLRPVLGATVDQIYEAYLAEDEDGREQIHHYLELLTAKYLPQKLAQSETLLLPPSREQAQGQYPIGQVYYSEKALYPFGLREQEWIQHMAILGRSGGGKTNLGFQILTEFKRKGKPFLVFDWKRNYRDLLALPEFHDMQVYTVGRDIAPLAFNPLIPPAGTDPKTWLKKLNQVIAHAYCLGNGVLFLLQQAVDAVYEDAGVYDGTVQEWPTVNQVLAKARSMDTRGREAGWLSSTLRALSSLCFGEMDKLLNTDNNTSLDHLLEEPVILELDALTQSDKVFVVSALLLWMHHKRMAEQEREQLRHITVIEESHHILSDERRSLVGGQSVMEIVFREIREFGEALVLLDQHPSKISLPALGNTYTTICFGLKHKTDINAMGQCLLLDKERDILGMLDVGQAVVKLQGRIGRPFQISIPEFKIQKGKVTDELVQRHMRGFQPAPGDSEEITDAPPTTVLPPLSSSDRSLDNAEITLLTDIGKYPSCGVAARYRRLGISVRQGQKITSRLLEKALIHDGLEITTFGRRRTLRLTEKGEQLLTKTKAPA